MSSSHQTFRRSERARPERTRAPRTPPAAKPKSDSTIDFASGDTLLRHRGRETKPARVILSERKNLSVVDPNRERFFAPLRMTARGPSPGARNLSSVLHGGSEHAA